MKGNTVLQRYTVDKDLSYIDSKICTLSGMEHNNGVKLMLCLF